MEFRAQARFMRVSPQKARLVLDLIKGRRVEDALNTLVFTKKRVAATVEKLLRSALENANYLSSEKGLDVDIDKPVREERRRQRRAADEAYPSGADGTGFPLRAAHLAHRNHLWRSAARDGEGLATVVGESESAAGKKSRSPRVRPRLAPGVNRSKDACGQEESRSQEIMGQKVHPYGFRLGYTKPWKSRWFVEARLRQAVARRRQAEGNELKDKLKSAGVSSIEIERPGNKLRVIIKTARPGIIIGRKGAEIDKLKGDVQKRTGREVYIDIQEVHKPELDAQLVSESIALQLEKRVGFRRAMRKAVDSALRFGCKGIKVRVSGRLNGNEIARSEWYLQGRLPLHTLRADIDYGFHRSAHHLRRHRREVLGLQGEILPAKKREPQQAGAF